LMKWHINRKLVTVQSVKLSTTKSPSIKSVHNSFRSDSENHTNRNVRTSSKGFFYPCGKEGDFLFGRMITGMKNVSNFRSRKENASILHGNVPVWQ
jgi:hypothetical protein